MKLFVTGGCGFIGSNYIRNRFASKPMDEIMNYDLLTYAGNIENLNDIQNSSFKYSFEKGDICDREKVEKLLKSFKPDVIINFAAESHNSYSVLNPYIFFRTNTLGTQNLLDCARLSGIKRFHQISTCEVYGDMNLEDDTAFTEQSPYNPKTIYNASKASADHAVRAYHNVFGMHTTISISSNNYGPYQYPEKLIPLFLTNILEGKKLPLYRSSANRREWLHVDDHCRAIDMIIEKGRSGDTYNIGSSIEKSIEEIADLLIQMTNVVADCKIYVEDRPGHDRRYLLDSNKIIRELGWKPQISFEEGLKSTVEWYRKNTDWWKKVKNKKPIDETSW